MKHAVVSGEIRGSDIRPPGLLSRLREVSVEESRKYFPASALVEVACPSCGSDSSAEAFDRFDFMYRSCRRCATVFVSPRPPADALAAYYHESKAGRIRSEYLSGDGKGRADVLRARASWVGRVVDEEDLPPPRGYADVATSYPVLFNEMQRLGLFTEMHSVGPSSRLSTALPGSVSVVTDERPTGLAAVTVFEQLEHHFSPLDLLKSAAKLLAPGGLLFVTTRSSSGFDVLALWDSAPHIFVPEHLNMISVEGMALLLERLDLKALELSTPGQLDVEIVRQALEEDPELRLSRFADYLIRERDQLAHSDFQQFLQKHRLSSHLRVVAVKGQR